MESVTRGSLAGINLLEGLDPSDLDEVEAACVWTRYLGGEQVFGQDHEGDEVFFIVDGAVRVLTITDVDREVSLANVVAGDYFGELAAIDRKGRSARVVATEDSILAALAGGTFLDLMEHHAPVAVRVLRRFAFIIRTLDARVAELSTLTDPQRVMAELVRLAKPDTRRPGFWSITDMPAHKEIASWAGTDREVVARTIGELARDGIVERRTMGLLIKDWGRLQLMARS